MSLLSQVGAVALVLLLVLGTAVAGSRRRRRRSSWLDELASVRGVNDGVLIDVDHLDVPKKKKKAKAKKRPKRGDGGSVSGDGGVANVSRDLTGRQVTGPGGEIFFEYGGDVAPITRVSGEEHTVSNEESRLVVEISRGSVWRLGESGSSHSAAKSPLFVRTAAGDVSADCADLLVTCEPDGWTYALCFGGTATVARDDESVTLRVDQVARTHVDSAAVEVATTAAGTLEGDEVVRLHRRLDRGAMSLEPSGISGRR